jgi:hypothetical protein
MIEGDGILREPTPGNVPPYNLTLNPATTVGYSCPWPAGAVTFGGSVVGWAESFLADGVTTREQYGTAAEQSLEKAALDTAAVSDKRMAASGVLQWARLWRGCIYREQGPAPIPVIPGGVLAVGDNAVTAQAYVEELLEEAAVDANLWQIAKPIAPDGSLPTQGPNDGGVTTTQQGLSIVRNASADFADVEVDGSTTAPAGAAFVTSSMKWVFIAAGALVLLVLLSSRRR